MELNFTIIVQMGHFLLAYVVLKHYLFKPLVMLIQEQDQAFDALTQAVEARRVLVTHHQQALHDQWIMYQTTFAQQTPSMQEITPAIMHSLEIKHEVASAQSTSATALENAIKEQIIKKVECVH